MRIRFLAVAVVALLVACGRSEKKSEAVWPPNAEAIAAMNQGIGELEYFDYPKARDAFEKALSISPAWIDAKVNLAIAWLNLKGQQASENPAKGDYGPALRYAKEVLEVEPKNPYANFIAGEVLYVSGNANAALPYFDAVLAVDPEDPSTLFWKGKALTDLGRYEEADKVLARAIEVDPYQSSAHWLRRAPLMHEKQYEAAEKELAAFQKLEPPEGRNYPRMSHQLNAKSYVEIGKYAMAIRHYRDAPYPHTPSPVKVDRPDPGPLADYRYGGDGGPEFVGTRVRKEGESDRDFVLRIASRIGPGVALADVDGDGDTDVYLPEWNGPGRLYRNDGGMKFTDVTAKAGITTMTHGISAVFFDADGDSDLDLYVCAAGTNVFYQNDGKGNFVDRTKETGLGGGDVVSAGAVPGDFDHEGDVDLFVANYCRLDDASLTGAPDALFQNDRDGRFRDVAGEQKIDGGDLRSIGMLPLDVDGDKDTDLLVLRDRQPASLWLNERVWNFHAGRLPPDLEGDEPTWGATAGDIDRDGREELLVFRGPGANAELFRADGKGGLSPAPGPLSAIRWRTGVFLDADLDGWLDLLGDDAVILGEKGEPVSPVEKSAAALPATAHGVGFADLDGDGDLDRLYASNDGAGVVATIAPKGNHWIAFDLTGKEGPMPAQWAAPKGPGQAMEIRAGRLWQPLRARATTGFLSTIEGPVRFGLGAETTADFVRILWPDWVLQVELEQPADHVRELVELNRKPTSCPILFAWDGRDYRFITDFLGGGGLGFFVAPGVWGIPDPTEYVRIGKWSRPKDGRYRVSVMEPLEEITYLDRATLVAVDHPAGWDAYPNERFTGEPSLFPKDRLYAVADKIFPRRATDLAGHDILSHLEKVDRDFVPIDPDERFPGIAKEHALVLDFTGRVPETKEGEHLVLFLNGMLEYGFSRTVFSVSQAGIEYQPPRLEVPDGKGGFRTVIANIGAPAGMPKGMTVDVTGIVTPESPVIRIRTNLEIFWDRAFLGVDRIAEATVTRISAKHADLHYRGFPREYSPDGHLPILHDYGLMDPGAPMKNMAGDYTKYGDVTPLVEKFDDMYVIMNHGEEITLEYAVADLPELPAGWERTLILDTAGWCKDMDPYTACPDTVAPLPFRAMKGYPYGDDEHFPADPDHVRYRREWNTRHVYPR